MLRRNKFPPLPTSHEVPQNHLSPQLRSPFLQNAMSPAPLSRLQRRREDSNGKPSSLNCKLQRRNIHNNPQREQTQAGEAVINSDYYPAPKDGLKGLKIQRAQQAARDSREFQKLATVQSAPVLPQWQRQKREQEMSTQLSKQSQCPELPKEVRFGGVVEGRTEAAAMRKKQKMRSPSILKNGRTILNGSLIASKQRSRSCSVASGRGRAERQQTENNTNRIIKQKYKSIIARLQAETHTGPTRTNRFSAATYQTQPRQTVPSACKYRDEIFPPVPSSIFAAKKGREKLGDDISWMRVSELFKGRGLTLVGPQRVEVTRREDSYAQEYLVSAMNCLSGCRKLLQKIFEGQGVSPFGIYLLRIYQQSVWKYIIIDDYIPVIRTPSNPRPAFLSVKVPEEGPVDVWPFLLEKAYANYYSRYEALQLGGLIDFVEELAGAASRKIQLRTEAGRKKDRMSEEDTVRALQQARKQLKNGEALAVGELFCDKGFIPLLYNHSNDTLTCLDPNESYRGKTISFQNLAQLCRAIHITSPFRFQTCSSTIIRKGRPINGRQNFQLDHPSVRLLKIQSGGQVAVSLRQREKRLFHLKEQYGQYIWCRFLLLQKEGEHGFRWISGEYAQRKAISFIQYLQPGEYWLLIQPQWRPNSPSELTLHLYSRQELSLQRVIYRPEERVIESACLDLAQRFGQLNQINKYICSYNYVSQKVGLIIQNIVNQRVNGDVTVMRSIRGLKCKVQILPVNRQFYFEEEGEDGERRCRLKQEIELDIPKGDNFTVVLKLKGGIDRKFFRSFDFGC